MDGKDESKIVASAIAVGVTIGVTALLRALGLVQFAWAPWASITSKRDKRIREHRDSITTRVASGARKLRVLSHNVWAHHLVAAPAKMHRLQWLAKAVAAGDFDIVCVQELFVLRTIGPIGTAENFVAFARWMADAGLPYHTSPQLSLPGCVSGQNSGLAVFSRYPITSETAHNFTASAERANAKGVISCVVDISGMAAGAGAGAGTGAGAASAAGAASLGTASSVGVVVTHLDAPRRPEAVRRQEILEVAQCAAAAMGEADGASRPVIVCGDFNTCPRIFGDGGRQYEFLSATMQNPSGRPAAKVTGDTLRNVVNPYTTGTLRPSGKPWLFPWSKAEFDGRKSGKSYGKTVPKEDKDSDRETSPLTRGVPSSSAPLGCALDHMFVSSKLGVDTLEIVDYVDKGGYGVSDHLGVLAVLTMPKALPASS